MSSKVTSTRLRPAEVWQSDLWVLVLGYVRYALGRMSTAPSTASNFVRLYWQHFNQQQRTQILREVMDELMRAERAGETLGHKCDHETWTALAVWMGENGGRTK